MTSNSEKWDAFLAPLKSKKQGQRPQDSYDNKTIEPTSCMSRDLAKSLVQKVSVDKKELDLYEKKELIANTEASENQTPKQRVSTQQKRKPTNKEGFFFNDADMRTNKLIMPMSPDLYQEFEEKESIEEDESREYKKTKLLQKSKENESRSHISKPVQRQVKSEAVSESEVRGDNDDVTTIQSISSMSPDMTEEVEENENVEDEKLPVYKEKGEKNENPSPISQPVLIQMKTEAVDDNWIGDNDKVLIVGPYSSTSSNLIQTSAEKKSEEEKQSNLNKKRKLILVDEIGDRTKFDGVDKKPKLEAVETNVEENDAIFLSSNSDTEDETIYQRKNTFTQRESSDMKQQFHDTPKPTMEALSSSELPSGFPGKITSDSPKDRPCIRQTRKTDHRSTPLSKWTFKMFVNYVDFDKYVRDLCLPFNNSLVDKQDLDVLYDDVLGMFGSNSLRNCMLKENESRVLLDGILMKLSKKYKFRVQMEVKSKLQYLPTGTFDYMITTKNGVPLGCVGAKSPAAMEKKSFCQAVLELNLVQQLALKKGVDVENTPLFCILSDGYRFIFMQLKGTELFLEHTIQRPLGYVKSGAHTRSKVIQIRKLDGADDFKIMISSMTRLITSSLLSAEGPVVKKENELLMHFD